MFCQNCGKQIPDNSKFCNNCGAKVAYVASSQPTNRNTAPQGGTQKQKKKGSDFLVLIVMCLIVFFMAKAYGATKGRSMAESKNNYTEPAGTIAFITEPATTEPASTVSVNPEYSRVFTDRSILFVPAVFFNLESDCYVSVMEDGIVDHQQFGHKNDMVVEFIETVYVPVDGWSEADKQAYEKSIRDTYGNLGLDCAELKNVNVGNNYISFTLALWNMDEAKNVRAVSDAGLIAMDEGYTLWGMSDTEATLLSMGYIKR